MLKDGKIKLIKKETPIKKAKDIKFTFGFKGTESVLIAMLYVGDKVLIDGEECTVVKNTGEIVVFKNKDGYLSLSPSSLQLHLAKTNRGGNDMKTKYGIGDSFKFKEGKNIYKISLVGNNSVHVFDNIVDDWVLSKNRFEEMLESGEVELVKNNKPLYQKGTNFMNREATIFVITKTTDDEVEFFGNGRYNSLTKTCFDESLERGHLNICEPLNDEHSEDDISELFELNSDNKEQDVINNPSHYTFGKYECLDVAKEIVKDMSGEEAVMFFNAFKYLWRHKHKNGLQDLKKCEFYLKELIKLNEQNE